MIFVDCKSFGDWAVNLSRSMLTEHQVTTMFRFEERGCPAGYVIWFRGINKIVFFSAGQLYEILQNKGSKSPDEGIDLGTFEDMRPDRLFQEYHGTCF